MWSFENEEYRKKAVLEDMLVGMLYRYGGGFTFHGGTCVWRCCKGNRFSRDVDFYYDLAGADRSDFTKELVKYIKDSGIAVKEKGYSNTTDTLSIVVETNTKCKLDINFRYKKGSPIDYNMVDGSLMKVIGLTAAELLDEKIGVQMEKCAKGTSEIQDLYDIWILKDRVTMTAELGRRLSLAVDATRASSPANAGSLDSLILSGVAPTVDQILDDIKGVADGIDKKHSR